MKATIKITGDELLADQLFDWIKDALEQAAEDQEEFEHESGDMTYIDEVAVKDGAIVVTLVAPEEESEE